MYKCNNCGFEFGEEGITQISYQEYPGARIWKEDVSACCNKIFEEVE